MDTYYPLLLDFTKKVLTKLKEQFPQFDMNGDKNLWIIKPGHASRGRGITVLSKYNDILKYIRESKGRHWVV
jgi:tubulin monoglycylase TTLL3/8